MLNATCHLGLNSGPGIKCWFNFLSTNAQLSCLLKNQHSEIQFDLVQLYEVLISRSTCSSLARSSIHLNLILCLTQPSLKITPQQVTISIFEHLEHIFTPSPKTMLIFLFLHLHRPQRLHSIELGARGIRELTIDANEIGEMLKYRKASFPKSVSTTFVAHCLEAIYANYGDFLYIYIQVLVSLFLQK